MRRDNNFTNELTEERHTEKRNLTPLKWRVHEQQRLCLTDCSPRWWETTWESYKQMNLNFKCFPFSSFSAVTSWTLERPWSHPDLVMCWCWELSKADLLLIYKRIWCIKSTVEGVASGFFFCFSLLRKGVLWNNSSSLPKAFFPPKFHNKHLGMSGYFYLTGLLIISWWMKLTVDKLTECSSPEISFPKMEPTQITTLLSDWRRSRLRGLSEDLSLDLLSQNWVSSYIAIWKGWPGRASVPFSNIWEGVEQALCCSPQYFSLSAKTRGKTDNKDVENQSIFFSRCQVMESTNRSAIYLIFPPP